MAREEKTFAISGIDTYSDLFSSTSEGSFVKASNVVVDQQNLLSPRRGFEALSTDLETGGTLPLTDESQLFEIHDKLHYRRDNGRVYYYDDDKQWWGYYGNSNLIQPFDDGIRSRKAISNGNEYVTSSRGVKKISSLGSEIYTAGVDRPISADGSASTTDPEYPISPNSTVAYRALFGYKDENGNLLLGPPSNRTEVTTGAAADPYSVILNVRIPSNIQEGWFVQVYRSEQVASGNTPSDEMNFVTEVVLTASHISAAQVGVTDTTQDGLLGAPLYTNQSQEGAIAANFEPPSSRDICHFQGHTFYANTMQRQFIDLQLTGTGTDGLQAGDTITIAGATLTAVAGAVNTNEFRVYDTGSPTSDVDQTVRSLVTAINDDTFLDAFLEADISTDATTLGRIRIVDPSFRDPSSALWSVFFEFASANNPWLPDNPTIAGTADFVSGSSVLSNLTGAALADLEVGDWIKSAYTPSEVNQITAIDTVNNTITINQNANTTISGGAVQFKSLTFDNDRRPNRIYYSKFQEAEAVPLLNFVDVGPANTNIRRIVPLQTAIMIFTDKEVYRLTGTTPALFQITLLDNTAGLRAEDSIVTFENSILGLFDQGVCTVGSRVMPVSQPIKGELLEIFGETGDNLNLLAHAVSYESYGKYILIVPENAQSTVANKAYVLNNDTGAWTTWDIDSVHMIINPETDKLAKLTTEYISEERKGFNEQDIADEQTDVTVSAVSTTTLTVGPAAAASVSVGDIYYQSETRYSPITAIDTSAGTITLAEDLDWGLSNFTITANTSASGDSLSSIVTTTEVLSGASISGTGIQANTKVTTVSGTSATMNRTATADGTGVTLTIDQDYKVLPAISVEVEWNPIYMGSPTILKQFSEATLVTTSSLDNLVMGFKGITSAAYEDTTFTTESIGGWGLFSWGGAAFGGDPQVLRYRTYIPREKQRDSAIYPRIQSGALFNNFEVSGISIVYRTLSQRTTR